MKRGVRIIVLDRIALKIKNVSMRRWRKIVSVNFTH